MHTNRRALLGLAGAGLALAACQGTMPDLTTVPTVAADVADIAAGLLAVLPSIGTLPGVTASMMAKVSAAIGDLQTIAEQIKTMPNLTAAQPLVVQVEADVNVILGALAVLPIIPPPASIALQAAAVLLPVIESAVNLIVPAKLRAHAAKIVMTPAEARQHLRSLAHK